MIQMERGHNRGIAHNAALSDNDMKNGDPGSSDADRQIHGSAGEVFRVFLKLGLTSFGGPIAHLGYFRDELVVRRQWLDAEALHHAPPCFRT